MPATIDTRLLPPFAGAITFIQIEWLVLFVLKYTSVLEVIHMKYELYLFLFIDTNLCAFQCMVNAA